MTIDEINACMKAHEERVDNDKLTNYDETASAEDYLMTIDGMPAIVFWEIDSFYVCQHWIASFGNEDMVPGMIDYTKFPKPHDSRFKLVIEAEYH